MLNFLKPAREAKKASVAGVEGRKQWPEKRGGGAQVLVSLGEGVVSTGIERPGHRVWNLFNRVFRLRRFMVPRDVGARVPRFFWQRESMLLLAGLKHPGLS